MKANLLAHGRKQYTNDIKLALKDIFLIKKNNITTEMKIPCSLIKSRTVKIKSGSCFGNYNLFIRDVTLMLQCVNC